MVEVRFPRWNMEPESKPKFENLTIPVVIQDMIAKLFDDSTPKGVRENHLVSLKTIRDVIDNSMTKYKKYNR